MTISLEDALGFTQWILSIGLILQGIESIVTRRAFDFAGHYLSVLFMARIVLAAALLVPGAGAGTPHAPILHGILLLSSLCLAHRLSGSLCGGSDSMFFQVQLGMLAASLGFAHPDLQRLGLGWIAAQSVLSYGLAGIAKIRNPRWRNGLVLQSLLASSGPYTLWTRIRPWANAPRLCLALAWAAMVFELSFPSVLFLPNAARAAILALGLAFHLSIAAALGLNRFVWAWTATYPALLYFHAI